jgi:hypothetical protein
LACKGIAASGGSLTGTKLAQGGLALAILFGVASTARLAVRDQLLQRQADRGARQWLGLAAEGRAEPMLELMTHEAIGKVMPTMEPGQLQPFFVQVLASALMRHDPFVLKLREQGPEQVLGATLREATLLADRDPCMAVIHYTTIGPEPKAIQYTVVLKRLPIASGQLAWRVDSWSLDP